MKLETWQRQEIGRAFNRAAPEFDSAATLFREIAERMIERLSFIRLNPRDILDAGSGTGHGANLLRRRYKRSSVVELDYAIDMLRERSNRRRALLPWSNRRSTLICADFQQMPLLPSSFDLVWSNLALHWAQHVQAAFAEAFRVMRPGSLIMFTMFGPDTLKELKNLSEGIRFRVNPFLDMHDVGDMLVHAGYADPVMDMEQLTLTYTGAEALLRELKVLGSSGCVPMQSKGLTPRRAFEDAVRTYDALRAEDGRLPATFEIVYGHAWKPQPRLSPEGRPVIDIRSGD